MATMGHLRVCLDHRVPPQGVIRSLGAPLGVIKHHCVPPKGVPRSPGATLGSPKATKGT